MNLKPIALALGATLVSPAAMADVDLAGKAVQIYGKLHASIDSYDRGAATAAIAEPGGIEVASNSSRLGFKGEKELGNGLSGVWKLESTIDVSGESGTLSSRNRYVGLGGSWGNVLVGIRDTPFKDLGGDYTLFGDTVGDYRALLGSVSAAGSDKEFTLRAQNMVQYDVRSGGFSAALLYSADPENKNSPDGGNGVAGQFKNTAAGVALGYAIGGLNVGAAWEKHTNIDAADGKSAKGVRVGVKYKLSALQLGGIYEKLSDDGYGAAIDRSAYGLNAAYRIGEFMLAAQYLKAAESKLAGGGDGATQYTVGGYYNLAKEMQLYLAYAALKNDPNASFQLARDGHGTAFAPTQAGETVSAISVGGSYSF